MFIYVDIYIHTYHVLVNIQVWWPFKHKYVLYI